MFEKKAIFLLVITILVVVSLACNLGGSPVAPTVNPDEANPEEQPGEEITGEEPGEEPAESPTEMGEPSQAETPVPTATTIPYLPLGLRQGLASLNSYLLKINIIADGPTSKDKNHSLFQVEYTSDGDKTHNHTESVSSSADDPEENQSISDQYQIGDKSCSISGEGADREAELSNVNAQQSEMRDAMTGLADTILVIENPQFIGTESVNGIQTNHFKFNVTGLGKKSGAEVTQSAGEYWVAQDGQYLVKYDVVLETRSAPASNPEAQVLHVETHAELSNINQPIQITMPAECK
jgi:hypothetical protein